jgi:hypothetical protein
MISSKQFNSSGLHLEGTELISQLQLDIAGRVDDVALDLVATIVRDGAVEDLGPLGFVTVKPRDDHGA